MKRIGWIVLAACCVAASAADRAAGAKDRAAVFGRWATEGSIIEISETNGALQARVVALNEPLYHADEAGPAGTARVDSKNPDAAQRDRPILGIELLSDYSWDGKQWRGRIYDPETGNTYKSQMRVDGDGNLLMRGYIGMPMLGRTKVFAPISSCSGNIPQMLAQAKLTSTC
jgi:uncharacterized protein (DUF2147 family)